MAEGDFILGGAPLGDVALGGEAIAAVFPAVVPDDTNFLIAKRTLEEVTQSLIDYLPNGPLWEGASIPGTNLHALITGLATALLDYETFLRIYNNEFIPSSTETDFLENWERAVGIPDSCFPGPDESDLDVRRLHVLVKLASLGVQTAADFENLATIMGFPGTEVVSGVGSEFESVTNGGFDTDTDWTKGTGWTISASKANKAAGVASDLEQDITAENGKLYVVKYDISGRTAGTLTPDVGGTNGVARSTNGSFEELITGGSSDTILRFEADSSFDGSIDNVSVRGSLPLPGAVFTIVVKYSFTGNNFPLIFPISFGSDQFGILTCLFNKLKPANCKVITEITT